MEQQEPSFLEKSGEWLKRNWGYLAAALAGIAVADATNIVQFGEEESFIRQYVEDKLGSDAFFDQPIFALNIGEGNPGFEFNDPTYRLSYALREDIKDQFLNTTNEQLRDLGNDIYNSVYDDDAYVLADEDKLPDTQEKIYEGVMDARNLGDLIEVGQGANLGVLTNIIGDFSGSNSPE